MNVILFFLLANSYILSHFCKIYNIVHIFQACSFLVSSRGVVVSEERELEENVFSNGNYVETPFLFEQEITPAPADPISTEMVEKTVFVVFFSGEQARIKILKICDAFGANCYPIPEDKSKQRQITSEVC
ncbi:V-type proton ATPase subunit a1-like isoform X3 [Phaseolus vulgaris]|uniref:V-type proton ATPase subunit a1-like isoform X3 n=1 Tax=Phaseolus vulgaris TaxID=3885 RepID=UPI0035CA42DE